MIGKKLCSLGVLVSTVLFGAHAASAEEVELRTLSSLSTNLVFTKDFVENFVEPLNERGKGVIKVNLVGGPEVTPPGNSGKALERGIFDMLFGPVSYFQDIAPEATALQGSTLTPAQMRENGGWDILREVLNNKLNAEPIAFAQSGTQYNLYFTEKPKITENGVDLTGVKMRSTQTYRSMLESLGAVPVSVKGSEIYTSLKRGVVSGFAWPNAGLTGLGVADAVKYRLLPGFWRTPTLISINLDVWKSLSPEAQALVQDVAQEFEKKSVAYLDAAAAKETDELVAAGMQIIELEGQAADKFLTMAYDLIWKKLSETSPEYGPRMREKFYQP